MLTLTFFSTVSFFEVSIRPIHKGLIWSLLILVNRVTAATLG